MLGVGLSSLPAAGYVIRLVETLVKSRGLVCLHRRPARAFSLKILRFFHHATQSCLYEMVVLPKLSRKKCLFRLVFVKFFKTNQMFCKENSCVEMLLLYGGKNCEMRELKEPIFKMNLNISCFAVLKVKAILHGILSSQICVNQEFGVFSYSDV